MIFIAVGCFLLCRFPSIRFPASSKPPSPPTPTSQTQPPNPNPPNMTPFFLTFVRWKMVLAGLKLAELTQLGIARCDVDFGWSSKGDRKPSEEGRGWANGQMWPTHWVAEKAPVGMVPAGQLQLNWSSPWKSRWKWDLNESRPPTL